MVFTTIVFVFGMLVSRRRGERGWCSGHYRAGAAFAGVFSLFTFHDGVELLAATRGGGYILWE